MKPTYEECDRLLSHWAGTGYNIRAQRAGWDLFMRDSPNDDNEWIELQAIDDPEIGAANLKNDCAAWLIVAEGDINNDYVARAAMAVLKQVSPAEVSRIYAARSAALLERPFHPLQQGL